MSQPVRTVSTYDAKAHFSRILAEVQNQQIEVVVTRHEKPVAKIIPFPQDRVDRQPGALKGQVLIPDGWDQFSDADERDWYGSDGSTQ